MPSLLACVDPGPEASCPRVIHRALQALAQMIEGFPEGAIEPHAEAMLQR